MTDFDVIVIGGGGAGMAAAWHAADQGASVLLVEAARTLGGATALATGVIYAAGTRVQRAAGIADTPAAMYEYMQAINQWSLKPSIAHHLCHGGASLIDWLVELGNAFPPDWLIASGMDATPRGHQSVNAGIGIAESLANGIAVKGVEVALDSRVQRLLIEQGRVTGIAVDGAEIRAKAVIIATGGFGNNPALIERLYPTAAFHGDRVHAVYKDAPFNLGDGILMGEAAGAHIAGIDTGLLNPTPNFTKTVEGFLPDWSIVVNRDGKRFLAETAPYPVTGYLMNEQPEKRCFAVFDEAALTARGADESGPKDFSGTAGKYKNGHGSMSWRRTPILANAAKGRVKIADSLEELANRADICAKGLLATVARYNADCDRGVDSEFGKIVETFHPVRTPPFYAVEVRASLIASTHAGLDINGDGEVVDRTGAAIPGLYAGGEVLGCALGRRYIGGGIGIANALIFGRLAGMRAAGRIRAGG